MSDLGVGRKEGVYDIFKLCAICAIKLNGVCIFGVCQQKEEGDLLVSAESHD